MILLKLCDKLLFEDIFEYFNFFLNNIVPEAMEYFLKRKNKDQNAEEHLYNMMNKKEFIENNNQFSPRKRILYNKISYFNVDIFKYFKDFMKSFNKQVKERDLEYPKIENMHVLRAFNILLSQE